MVLGGQTPKAVSEAIGVCPRTVRKWVDRFKAEGLAGLRDRSSRPDHLRQPTPQATVDRIEALRRQRLTGKAIAAETGVSPATVSRVLKRLGLNRLSALEPAEPLPARAAWRADPHRHQKARPFRQNRPSHHRRPHRPEQHPRGRLGIRPCLP
jgi:transposase